MTTQNTITSKIGIIGAFIIAVAIAIGIAICLYPTIQLGSKVSLVITLGIVTSIVLYPNPDHGQKNCKDRVLSLIKYVKGDNASSTVVNLLLLGATIMALWLTVRVGMHLFSVFAKTGAYSEYQILEILTYVLTVTLCLSLFDIHNKESYNDPQKLLGVGIQAFLIALLIYIYLFSSSSFLSQLQGELNGAFAYLVIGIAIVAILLALIYMTRKLSLPSSDKKN